MKSASRDEVEKPGLLARLFAPLGSLTLRIFGPRMGAMVILTWKSAFRLRLLLVLVGLMIGAVFILPLIIKHDGTARGFTQILMTYSLAAITGLLGFSTLWLACGTLARDIEECQMQLLMTKPIPRWQIWLGRWAGIVTLDLLLLCLAGVIVYGLTLNRSRQLSAQQQKVLSEEIFVARASARPAVPDLKPQVDAVLAERMKDEAVAKMSREFVRGEVEKQVKAFNEALLPGRTRAWKVNLGADAKARLKDEPVYLRVKFFSSEYSGSDRTFAMIWGLGPSISGLRPLLTNDLAAETPVEFQINAPQVADDGTLYVGVQNWNDVALVFPMDDGMEVLYREGGFGANFARGMMIIWFWLALLAALGLACSSRMSFPVASFVSICLLLVAFSGGTIRSVIDQGGIMNVDPETGFVKEKNTINEISVKVFGGLSRLIGLVQNFSPVESLSTGRSITWGQLAQAFAQVVVLIGGIFAAIGIAILTRREIALPT